MKIQRWSFGIAVVLWACLLILPVESTGIKVDQKDGIPKRINSRIRRSQSRGECILWDEFWDVDESVCKICTMCPSGSESTAKYCGFGLGERGTCVPCPTGTYRSQDNELDQKCRPCSSCDPDAVILANCSASADTQCGPCKPGTYNVSGFCVSCKDHPNGEECEAEMTTRVAMTMADAFPTNGSEKSTPPTPLDCPTVNQTVIIGAHRALPRAWEDCLCFVGGICVIVLYHLVRSIYLYLKTTRGGGGDINKPISLQVRSTDGQSASHASLTSGTTTLPHMIPDKHSQNHRDIELGLMAGAPGRNESERQAPDDSHRAAGSRGASVQAGCNAGQTQEARPIKKKEGHRDKDEAERVPLLAEKQGATPSTMTAVASGSRPTEWGRQRIDMLEQRQTDSTVGTEDDEEAKSSITNTSNEETVVLNGLSKSERTRPSLAGLPGEMTTTSNNVAMALDSSSEQSHYGSLQSLDEEPAPDDTLVKGNAEYDMMAVIGKAEDMSNRYHLEDLDEMIVRELGLKLNPEKGPAFLDAKSLAVLFNIDTDIYSNFREGYFFQDMIIYLNRKSPGQFKVHDLLQKLKEIKRCDVALTLAVHVNEGNLKKRCLSCRLLRNNAPHTLDSACRGGNDVNRYALKESDI